MAEESVANFLHPVLVKKSKLDQHKMKWLEAALQLSPIPPVIQSSFTLLHHAPHVVIAETAHMHTYIYFTSSLFIFSQ